MKKSKMRLPFSRQFILGIAFGFFLCFFTKSPDSMKIFAEIFQEPVLQTHSPVHCSNDNRAHHDTIMKYGSPQPDYLRQRDSYVLLYDGRSKNPLWVYEYITPQSIVGEAKRSNFKNDSSIPDFHCARLEDYKNFKYDRGHLAPAGNNKYSQKAMDETFLMSNMSPQVGVGFNRDAWRFLEEKIRDIAVRSIGVHVITGPLFLPEHDNVVRYPVIGSNVAVPTHFFKVILVEKFNGGFDSEAWLMPNQPIEKNIELSSFSTSIDKIERVSGLVFFPKLQGLDKH